MASIRDGDLAVHRLRVVRTLHVAKEGSSMKAFMRLLAGLVVVAMPAVGRAATVTWDSNGATTGVTDGAGGWLDASQWWDGTSNVTWTSGDDAVFGVGGTGGAVTLSSTTAAGSLTFNPFSGTYTLGTAGQTLTLGSSGITMNAGAGAVTLASPVTLSAPQSWTNNSSSLLTASGAITNGGNLLTVAGSGSTTLSAAISGAGGLTKNGSGVLLVSASNTYTGAVTVNAGTLRVGNAWALGAISGTATVNAGGTLDINGNDLGGGSAATGKTVVLAGGTLVNNGVERQHAIKTLVVTADSTIGGSGKWDVRNTGATLTVNAGARLTKVGSNTVLLGVSSSQIINNGEIVLNDGSLGMLDAIISGTGSFTVNNGKLFDIQSGSNALAMTLNSGQLKIAGVPGGRQAGPLTVVASTTNTLTSNNNGVTISGNLLGGGRLNIVQSAGTSTILSGSNSGFTGTLGISNSAGSVLFAGANAMSGSAAFILSGTNGGSYAAANTVTGTVTHRLGSLSGTAGRLDNFAAGSSLTYVIGNLNTDTSYAGLIQNTSGTTAVTKEGTGKLTLSGSNTYTGVTTVNAGTLEAASSALASTSAIAVNGAYLSAVNYNPSASLTLDVTGSATISGTGLSLGAVTNANTAANALDFSSSTGTITLTSLTGAGNTRFRFGASIGGTVSQGAVTIDGVGTLGTVSGGTLGLNGATASITTLTGGQVNLSNNVLLSVQSGTFSGSITGAGGLTKTGGDALVLNAANSYTGATTVRAGTLVAQANAPNNAAGAFGNATSAIVVGDASTAGGGMIGVLAAPGVTIGRSINVNNQGAGTTLGGAGTSGNATFSGAITLNKAVTLQAATGGTVDFTGAWTTNNNGITIGSVGNAGTVRLSSTLGPTGPLTLSAGTLDLNGRSQAVGGFNGSADATITSAAAAELTVAVAVDSAFSGAFTGAVSLRKQGLAALTLAGVSTNTGNTIVEAGTLVVGVDNAISGSSAITIGSAGSRGTLAVNHNLTISSLTLSGSGGELTGGGGLVTLANAATGTATITVNGGTNFFHANATLGSDTVVNVASGASFEFHNALSGSLSLTKSGDGVLNVNGDNDKFSGNFFITAGQVNILAGMNQIGTGTTTLSGGATINLNGQSFGDRIVVLNGTILNAGGTATTTTVSGSSTFSGTTQGTVNIDPGGNAQFSGALGSGTAPAYVTVSGSGQATFAGIVSGSASVTVNNGGMATFNDTVSGQVISHGVSTFNGSLLSGGEAQVQSGGSARFEKATENGSAVSVEQNALAEFRGTMAGTATVTGSAIFTSASGLTGSLKTNAGGVATLDNVDTVTGEIHNDGQLVVNRGSGSQTISGWIHGSGSFLKQGAGRLVVTGSNNTYSGGTTIDSGTLSATSGNAFGTGAITLGGGATLDLADLVVSNTIAANGGTIRGGSIMGLFSGSATLSGGQTTFKAGIAAGARIGVAATGTATFGDGASVNAGATVVNDGMVRINRSTNNTAWQLAAPITGTGGLRVDGGYVQLSGSNTYSGLTQVSGSGALLAVNGSVAGKVQVDANAALGGSGLIVGNIGGSGLIGPGNSPGILTVQGQVEPTATTSFAFEFMQQDPIWSAATASKNDVLQLTNMAPFASPLQESNIVNIYFEVASLAKDDTFRGGFFSNYASGTLNFAAAIGSPTYQYYVLGSGSGTHDYNGTKYYTWSEYLAAHPGSGITGVTASVVTVESANFSSGTVTNGQVTQFVIIPEPDTIIFAGIGIAMAGWSLCKRRRITRILKK